MSTDHTSPIRTLEIHLDDLLAQLKLLPIQSRNRPRLIQRIRNLENEINAHDDGGIAR